MRFKSLLFIPMNKYSKKIYTRIMHRADALILDLEDAVPKGFKEQARIYLPQALELYKEHPNVFVRVNACADHFDADMAVLRECKHSKIIYPKFDKNHRLTQSELAEYDIIPVLETPAGLYYADECISQISNIHGVMFGVEDLSAELGIQPSEETMQVFAAQAILAARMSKSYCIGYISDFTDLNTDELRRNCRRSKELGFKAAFCIHPTHLDIINEVYTVEPQDIIQFEGVVSHEGRMIGPPSIKRILNR